MTQATLFIALSLWCGVGAALVAVVERAELGALSPARWRDVAAGCAVALLAVTVRPPAEAVVCGATCVGLVVAAGADARTGLLFDAITLPTAVLVTTLAILTGTGAAATAGVLLLVGIFGGIVLVSRGRAMGLGDVKAMYAVGAAFGPTGALLVVFFSCISGIAATLARGSFARHAEIRFGPHLAIGSTIALIAGRPIRHYLLGTSP